MDESAQGQGQTKTSTGGDGGPGGATVEQVPTGILGLDQILGGGLPKGRAILVVGSAGSGKTILATEFLARGALAYDEPGVLVTFEESINELSANAAGFGWDFKRLQEEKRLQPLVIDLAAAGGMQTGSFDLEALFVRIGNAIKKVGARRLVLDGINNLLASFNNEPVVRSELLRLLRWLKDQDLTVVVTGEAGEDGWTRLGFEEYLADGLIALDHRVEGKVAKRLLRVVKCRGISHSTDEFPFLIAKDGISLFPVNAADLDYDISAGVVESGVAGLDEMLGHGGFYKGSAILVSGSAGTGKSTLGASFVDAACRRGERAIYFTFEESPSQVVRNMKSVGIDLAQWQDKGLLTIRATRAMQQGIESHLTEMQEAVRAAKPSVAFVDPISALLPVGTENEVKSMMTRMIDYFRSEGITTMMSNLAKGGVSGEAADFHVSSMADTWLLVRVIEENAERNNIIQVLKSRGMDHSRLVREFNFTDSGIEIVDAYIGLDGIVIGSARHTAEAKDKLHRERRRSDLIKKKEELAEKRRAMEAQVARLEAEHKAEEEALAVEVEANDRQEAIENLAVNAVVSERSKSTGDAA